MTGCAAFSRIETLHMKTRDNSRLRQSGDIISRQQCSVDDRHMVNAAIVQFEGERCTRLQRAVMNQEAGFA
jgi:hypothetical protein